MAYFWEKLAQATPGKGDFSQNRPLRGSLEPFTSDVANHITYAG